MINYAEFLQEQKRQQLELLDEIRKDSQSKGIRINAAWVSIIVIVIFFIVTQVKDSKNEHYTKSEMDLKLTNTKYEVAKDINAGINLKTYDLIRNYLNNIEWESAKNGYSPGAIRSGEKQNNKEK